MSANIWKEVEESCGFTIGIDLGTSNSCVAFWDEQKSRVKVVKNAFGSRITPSTIYFGSNFDEYVVGNQPTSYKSGSVVSEIKQFMGASVLLNSNEKPEYLPQDESVIVCLNQNDEMMKFSPITLSSYILRYFRQLVQDYIKKKPIKDLHGKLVHSIESVIIGIPVNFPQSGKQATIKAARLAGFKHVSLMIESTGAALSYGLLVAGEKAVLVFDMGGGTTDVTVIGIKSGKSEVLATAGHSKCGGCRADKLLLQHIMKSIGREYNTVKAHDGEMIAARNRAMHILVTAARSVKETLTSNLAVVLDIPKDIVDVMSGVETALVDEVLLQERCVVRVCSDNMSSFGVEPISATVLAAKEKPITKAETMSGVAKEGALIHRLHSPASHTGPRESRIARKVILAEIASGGAIAMASAGASAGASASGSEEEDDMIFHTTADGDEANEDEDEDEDGVWNENCSEVCGKSDLPEWTESHISDNEILSDNCEGEDDDEEDISFSFSSEKREESTLAYAAIATSLAFSPPDAVFAVPGPLSQFILSRDIYSVIITQAQLACILQPLLDDVKSTVSSAVREYKKYAPADMSSNESDAASFIRKIDEVVLVGGSTAMPTIRYALREALSEEGYTEWLFVNSEDSCDGDILGNVTNAVTPLVDILSVAEITPVDSWGKSFCTSIDPNLAVVQGLAIKGAIKMGVNTGKLKDLLMIDALPNAIGVITYDNSVDVIEIVNDSVQRFGHKDVVCYFEPILERGMKLPAIGRRYFYIPDCKTRSITLEIYEEVENGDCDALHPSNDASTSEESVSHMFLGGYDVMVSSDCLIPPREEGDMSSVCISFEMTESGLLKYAVMTRDELESKSSGLNSHEQPIQLAPSNTLSTNTSVSDRGQGGRHFAFLVCACMSLVVIYVLVKILFANSLQSNFKDVVDFEHVLDGDGYGGGGDDTSNYRSAVNECDSDEFSFCTSK